MEICTFNFDELNSVMLGRQGENGVRQIVIDLGDWPTVLDGPDVMIVALRPGEDSLYVPAGVTVSGSEVTWEIDSVDTALDGAGYAEIRLSKDGAIKKSHRFTTRIALSLMGNGEPAQPQPPEWAAQIMQGVEAATTAAEGAAADAAAAAAQAAEMADEVTDLKGALNIVTGVKMLEFAPGYYANSVVGETVTGITSHSYYACAIAPCTENDRVFVNVISASLARGWAYLDAEYKVLEPIAAANTTYNHYELPTPPTGTAYVTVNNRVHRDYRPTGYYAYIGVSPKDAISNLKSATDNRLMTDEIKIALLACMQHLAWADEDGQDYYDALDLALNPPQDLVSITAVFTQSGPVYLDTQLSTLRGSLVVTANYSDSSSSTIYAYTLTGTLTEGTSVITVTYGGKTTTFNVTVTDNTLLYELPQATTFNGSTAIDTQVQLIPNDRDFTVLLDFTSTSTARQFAFYAGYQNSPYYGVGLECQKNTAIWGAMGYNSYVNFNNIAQNVRARVVIRHSAGSGKINAICWANNTLTDGEVSVTIVSPNDMLIGAYDSSGALGFIGTITEFRAYTRYFSDNDAIAYAMDGGDN